MKTYILEITIREGCDEFWEAITENGNTGTDAVRDEVQRALYDVGFQGEDCIVRLKAFIDEETS